MFNPGELLENVLNVIEKRIKEDINADILADTFGLSSIHLQRLFKFAFKQPLGSYIRSRRLSASLESLLYSGSTVIDIAMEYGFDYEQSYIRTFKREFGVTPGDLRKTGQIGKITPPLHIFDANKLGDSVIFGPDIVMVPQFWAVGKKHRIPFRDSLTLAPKAARQFWDNDRMVIRNAVHPKVYIGLTRTADNGADYSWYLSSIQVKNPENLPAGFDKDIFDTSLCAKFSYIGRHHYYDINREIAGKMYEAIDNFINDRHQKYNRPSSDVYFEKIDTGSYDGTFCQLEWFTPISEK